MSRATSKPVLMLMLLSLGAVAIPAPASASWPTNGAGVGVGSGTQDQMVVVSDGQGGAIEAWRDTRTDAGDIYVQRLSPGGTAMWTAGGVAVCTAAGEQRVPALAPDGVGGAIVAWSDMRSDPNGDIYAQRINASGAVQWAGNGVALVSGPSNNDYTPYEMRMVSDGLEGAILVYQDNRHADGTIDPNFSKIWAQRVGAGGAALWGNGVPVGTAVYAHQWADLASDGRGGAVVAWMDGRVFGDYNISVQRLNPADGSGLWGPDGVYACAAAGWQWYPAIIEDGTGGVIVAWEDERSDANGDIYAQRINGNGVAQWTADGVALVTGPSSNNSGDYFVKLATDGAGGAILAFSDNRNADGSLDPSFSKVWLQRVGAGGAALWGNGEPVSSVVYAHGNPHLVSDGEGGAIVAWQDGRVFGDFNISVQRVDGSGAKLWGPDGMWACSAPGWQTGTAMVEDGQGGAIVAWQDQRSDASDVYSIRTCSIAPLLAVEPPRAEVKALWLAVPKPNPVVRSMSYEIALPRSGRLTVDVIDLTGRLRARLVDGEFGAGRHPFVWSTGPEAQALRSGMYYLRARYEGASAVRPFVLLR